MKLINISSNTVDIKSALTNSKIFPKGNAEASVIIKHNNISIKLAEDIDKCQEAFIVAYDKKTEQVLGISELIIGNESLMTISCCSEFWTNILDINNFQYARLCIAIRTGDSYAYFFVKSQELSSSLMDEKDGYVGVISDYIKNDISYKGILYFSNSNQLSVKGISEKKWLDIYATPYLKKCYLTDNIITFEISYFKDEKTTFDFQLYTSNYLESVDYIVEKKELDSSSILNRENILIQYELEKFITKGICDIKLMCKFANYFVGIKVTDFEDMHIELENNKECFVHKDSSNELIMHFSDKLSIIDSVSNGDVVPSDAIDVELISVNKNVITLHLKNLKENMDSAAFFFWNSESKKPLMIRSSNILNNVVKITVEENLLFQMQHLEYKYMRFAIAIKYDTKYVCGFFRSLEAKNSNRSIENRQICKMHSLKNDTLMCYWNENGYLSLKFKRETNFDLEYYKCKLDRFYLQDNKLVCFIHTPKLVNIPVFELISMDLEEDKICAKLDMSEVAPSELYRNFIVTIDLSDVDSEFEGNYSLTCTYGQETFTLYFECDISPYGEVITMLNNENKNIDLGVFKMEDYSFLLHVGKITPVMLSIVTAVYNTAPFLAEMINSVLEQDTDKLGEYLLTNKNGDWKKKKYQKLYEFILVDDGSTDGSADILDDYARMSDIIQVIHKPNGGVSSARNAGILASKGKYFNFVDSDDKLSHNFIQETLLYFEEHYDEIDILTTPLRFFDALNESHWSNSKFKRGTRIIDLNKDYKNVLMYVNASIFKSEKIKNVRMFNEKLRTAEDINFIYSFFLEDKPVLAVTDRCKYMYRRRSTGEESLIQASKKDRNRYMEYFTVGMNYLTSTSMKLFNEIPMYIKHLIACDIQWRFLEDTDAAIAKSVLSDEEFETYKNHLIDLLKIIDVDIIWAQEKIYREQKMYMSRLKYDRYPDRKYIAEKNNIEYYFDNTYLTDAASNYMQIDYLSVKNDTLCVEGTMYTFEECSIPYININDTFYELPLYGDYDFDKYALGEKIFFGKHFKYEYPLDVEIDEVVFDFYEKIGEYYVHKTDIRYADSVALTDKFADSYIICEKWVIRREGTFRVRPLRFYETLLCDGDSLHSIVRYENDLYNQMSSHNIDTNILNQALKLRKKALHIIENKSKYNPNKIWLISDNIEHAGDNGEALFIYLNKIKPDGIDAYFVIDEKSDDFIRLQQYGNVVPFGSDAHKLLHFMAEYVISSCYEKYVTNPFLNTDVHHIFKDLSNNPKFVFLQHGVIKDDMSEILNKFKINAHGFVTSSKKEYKSMFNFEYMYSEDEIWLTGMPRFDRLYNDEKNYIVIMPTWREFLSDRTTTGYTTKSGFENTEYFKFYNSLLNDKRLISAVEKYGYKIALKLHPIFNSVISLFDKNAMVELWGNRVSYITAFAQSKLCVTDYSSCAMDFAYLRKPVIYTQFDKEKFYSGEHIYKQGDFDYVQDGFGEVTYNLDELIDTIIEYMENDCKLKALYRDRAESFFEHNDQNNCERVYKKLIEKDRI